MWLAATNVTAYDVAVLITIAKTFYGTDPSHRFDTLKLLYHDHIIYNLKQNYVKYTDLTLNVRIKENL